MVPGGSRRGARAGDESTGRTAVGAVDAGLGELRLGGLGGSVLDQMLPGWRNTHSRNGHQQGQQEEQESSGGDVNVNQPMGSGIPSEGRAECGNDGSDNGDLLGRAQRTKHLVVSTAVILTGPLKIWLCMATPYYYGGVSD